MKKMFLKFILLCLCLWRLDGVFGDEVKSVSVMEGDSVSLNSGLTEIQEDDVIIWTFGSKGYLIAKTDGVRNTIPDNLDGRFRDRLKLDKKTGSLTIMNIRTEDAGVYEVEISGRSSSSTHRFTVTVYGASVFGVKEVRAVAVSVNEGDSVSLNSGLTEMKDDHMIQWKFKNTLIAEINNRADRFAVYDDVLDGRFRDRLKLDNQTGSLTITHTTTEHAGDYKLLINSEIKRFSLTVNEKDGETREEVTTCRSNRTSLNGVFGDEVKSVSVTAGDSVSLNSGLTEIQEDEEIIWTFGSNGYLIAKTDGVRNTIPDNLDERFRDRLKLDKKTGSLTIMNIRTEDAGVYEVKISGSSSSSTHRFSVTVYGASVFGDRRVQAVSVTEGDSVSLNSGLTEMKDDDVIQWRFGDENTLIAEINKRADRFTVYEDVLDGRFRDRLKLDNQTGSLTVTHTTTEHAGDYKLLINSDMKRFSLTVNGVFGDEVTSVSVTVGDSVSLNSGLTEIQKGEKIIWTFGSNGHLIAKTDGVNNMIPDGRFGDRLKLDKKTGSLTITNIRTTDSGLYEVEISGSSSLTKHRFSVTVSAATT